MRLRKGPRPPPPDRPSRLQIPTKSTRPPSAHSISSGRKRRPTSLALKAATAVHFPIGGTSSSTIPPSHAASVVSAGKLVGGRTLSQFADSVTADEVIGASAIKVNSDQAAGVAAQFAVHNNARLGTVQYELLKSSSPPAPVWRLTCHGAEGESLGTIVLHATKGSLLGFQGFAKSPIVPETIVAAEPPPAKPADPAGPATDRPKRTAPTTAAKPAPPKANPIRREPEPVRAVPVRPPPRQGPVDRIGNVFRRVFRD
jgi:hypothetical protein